jgi:signal transduction histidine kinase
VTATLPRTHVDTESATRPFEGPVVARWHELRRIGGLVAAGLAAISGIVLLWPAMAVVVALGLGVAVDATLALRSGRTSIVPTLVTDITLTGLALVAASVHPAAIGVVVAYYVLLLAVLAPSIRCWPIGLYAVAVGAAASVVPGLFASDAASTERSLVSGIIAVAVFGMSSIVIFREFALVRQRGTASTGRRIETADAIASASRALMALDEAKALASALESIRFAIGASVVFAERNVDDPDLGLAAVVVDRATDGSHQHASLDHQSKVPWSSMPGARTHLEGGAPFFYRVEEAQGTPSDRGGEGGLQVEVNVPIVMHEDWVGVIGAADTDPDRIWRTDDLVLLRTLADLTAAFWQRAEDGKIRDSLIGSLDGRLRYEEALAKASRALLGERSSELGPALDAVGAATDVDQVFITSTSANDSGDPVADVIEVWSSPGVDSAVYTGDAWPYSTKRLIRDAIQHGEMAHTHDQQSSQLVAGIEVGGAWFGSVGFVSTRHTRLWSGREESFLRTIAEMLGAFYERSQNRVRLEASLGSKDQLIASVSHELRTPLTAVVGLAEELREAGDGFPEAERKQLLGVIVEESSDMADLVEDLLIAARSDDGNIPVFPERVDLALLSQSVRSHLAIPDGVDVVIEDAASVAYADPVRVRQIIRNLLTNAFRYGGAEVSISFHTDHSLAYVDVHDSGDGINEDDQSTIFDPYGRAKAGVTVNASVGLGLTLSRRLAGLMGGQLEYIDGPGGTFRLGVPLPTAEHR